MEKSKEWASTTDEERRNAYKDEDGFIFTADGHKVIGYESNYNIDEGLRQRIVKYVEQRPCKAALMIVFYPKSSNGSSNDDLDEFKRWLCSQFECCCIQGHPFCQGNTRAVIGDEKNHEVVLLDVHPELKEEVFVPSHLKENTQVIVYHRYFEQLQNEHLRYVIGLSKKTSLPTLLLINDYSFNADMEGGIDLSDVDVICCNKPKESE